MVLDPEILYNTILSGILVATWVDLRHERAREERHRVVCSQTWHLAFCTLQNPDTAKRGHLQVIEGTNSILHQQM